MIVSRATTAAAWLAGWPARYPGLAFLVAVLLGIGGMVFAGRLPVGRIAAPATAEVRVQARLPGIDPATVETEITRPLEQALAGSSGLDDIESRTRGGVAEISLQWPANVEPDVHVEEVRQRVRLAKLPPDLDMPIVEAHESRRPAVVYAVTSTVPLLSAAQWVEHTLARPLRELPEVAAVRVDGTPEHEISIQPDMRRLAALGLTFDDLIHALREPSAVTARRAGRRRPVMAGSAEAIAARAVRLPSGEPIALAEVARIGVVELPGIVPQYRGQPALRLAVYPRAAADTTRVAERAHAQVAWLRANDLIPPEVAVHVVRDEARASKQALGRYARRAAMFVGVTLFAAALLFGLRAGALLFAAYLIWLPAAAAFAWIAGLALDTSAVAGLMLACAPFVVLVASSRRIATLIVAAAAIAVGVAGPWIADVVGGGSVFALTLLLGVVVAWLLSPWIRVRGRVSALVSRFKLRQPERIAAFVLGAATLFAAASSAQALNRRDTSSEEGVFQLQLSGDDLDKLMTAGAEVQATLQKLAGADSVSFSGTAAETLRLALDQDRLDALGIRLAQVGRALAIAREGLVVGEIVHGETLYRLRLQLPPGAAGETFDRLLLRGEQSGQPAVYLHDVGVALREQQPRERLRVDRKPAVEIVVHWKGGQVLQTLQYFCDEMETTEDYERECRFGEERL